MTAAQASPMQKPSFPRMPGDANRYAAARQRSAATVRSVVLSGMFLSYHPRTKNPAKRTACLGAGDVRDGRQTVGLKPKTQQTGAKNLIEGVGRRSCMWAGDYRHQRSTPQSVASGNRR